MYVCTNHILYIAVMQGIVQLKCLVLYICPTLSWTAATSAMLAGGKSQSLEKALSVVLWAVTRTCELSSAVHSFFPVIHQDLSLFWPQASTVFLQETLGRTRVRETRYSLGRRKGGRRKIDREVSFWNN